MFASNLFSKLEISLISEIFGFILIKVNNQSLVHAGLERGYVDFTNHVTVCIKRTRLISLNSFCFYKDCTLEYCNDILKVHIFIHYAKMRLCYDMLHDKSSNVYVYLGIWYVIFHITAISKVLHEWVKFSSHLYTRFLLDFKFMERKNCIYKCTYVFNI